MASSSTKEQFLRQMEQIVEGVKQNRLKVTQFVLNKSNLKQSVLLMNDCFFFFFLLHLFLLLFFPTFSILRALDFLQVNIMIHKLVFQIPFNFFIYPLNNTLT